MEATRFEIERLKAIIAGQETRLANLEARIIDLERDLQPVTERYQRLIVPKIERLEIIRRMIADIEASLPLRHLPPASNPLDWKPPPDYVPVEEQFRRTWQKSHANPQHSPSAGPEQRAASSLIPDADPANGTDPLKQLYRQLVRRFHPDLAAEPDERARRNQLLAEINAAYASGDIHALQTLAAQPAAVPVNEPLEIIQLHQLRQIHRQLIARLIELEQEHNTLINGDMIWIKLQVALAQRESRDYFQELSERLDREYSAELDRLDELKKRL